jgi:hypothetical protein
MMLLILLILVVAECKSHALKVLIFSGDVTDQSWSPEAMKLCDEAVNALNASISLPALNTSSLH